MNTPAPRRGRPKTTGTTPGRNIRVPDDEWAAWQSAAAARSQTVSEWLRAIAKTALKKSRKKSPES